MSEPLRALFVVVALALPAFLVARLTMAPVIGVAQLHRRWGVWLAATVLLFLAHDQWLYALGTLALVLACMRRETNPMALYVMLLMVAPPLWVRIPGFGVVNFIADLSHSRLLALGILLPAALQLRRDPRMPRLGSTAVDRLLLAFVAYTVLLQLRDTSLTDTLRALVYNLLDVVLLYYVASRTLVNRVAMREVLACCAMAGIVLAFIAAFEAARSWLLYSSLSDALGAIRPIGGYILRNNILRATATAGQSIPLGVYFVVAFGALLFLGGFARSNGQRLLLGGVMVLGLLASLARAPWLAAALLYLMQALASASPGVVLLRRSAALAVTAIALLISPAGNSIVALLPFVGTIESDTVAYRERLFQTSMSIFWRQPWTGSTTYLETPEMQTMIQGQGIIDMVNSYLQIAMSYGAIGLALFAAVFLLALARGLRVLQHRQSDLETRALAGTLCATTAVLLLLISTVSSITVIPTLYWLLLGMLSALPRTAVPLTTGPGTYRGQQRARLRPA